MEFSTFDRVRLNALMLLSQKISTPKQLYAASFITFMLAGGLTYIQAQIAQAIIIMSIMFLCLGFFLELYQQLKLIFKNNSFGKPVSALIISFVSAVIFFIATIIANHQVNLSTGLPPEYLDFSPRILATIYFLYVSLNVMIFLLGVYIIYSFTVKLPISLILQFSKDLSKSILNQERFASTPLSKSNQNIFYRLVASILILSSLCYVGMYLTEEHNTPSIKAAKTFIIVSIDYYSKSTCSLIPEKSRSLKLSDNIYSVATKSDSGWDFTTVNCGAEKGNFELSK